MLFHALALAATAASFVIIPEISEHDENIFKALPIDNTGAPAAYAIPETAFEQSISVPCSNCKGRNPHLGLHFTVEGKTRLMLNGFELYPDANPWSGDLQAAVVKGHRKPKNRKLGYSLAVYPKATAKNDNMELIEVDLKIIEVGNRFVDGIPVVNVELIKGPGGNIMMHMVDFDHSAETACTTIWCHAKELADKLWAQAQKIKGCGKPSVQGSHPGISDTTASSSVMPDVEYMPQAAEPAMPSREEWRHLLRSIAGHIVMPIIMGVTAGVAVAFFALCIQATVRRLTRLIQGKKYGERRSETAKSVLNEPAPSEEKVLLMA